MHLHILGIAGTFMGGLAQLARAAGHTVTGADQQVYPPMSDQLRLADIGFTEGFDIDQLSQDIDVVVVGNVMKRGLPIIEKLLNTNIPYISGPQWLYENILRDRWVLAVSGTHGKTTTASMLAWILEYAGLKPGFLIGGVADNFSVSARFGESPFFVIEADEYDTAFFDKRSKFVHYHPRTLVINNLEYDHADIFPDLSSIQTQFHHLIRMVPSEGVVIHPAKTNTVDAVLQKGCWTPCLSTAAHGLQADWSYQAEADDFSSFGIYSGQQKKGRVNWSLMGEHNAANALSAILAARHAGVITEQAIAALAEFKGVKRRMELRGEANGIFVYDDFAHHPTAISTTLNGLRKKIQSGRVLAVFEPRSNTMRIGIHKNLLGQAFDAADKVFVFTPPELQWDIKQAQFSVPVTYDENIDHMIDLIIREAQTGDHILIMSNGGFGGIHDKLLSQL